MFPLRIRRFLDDLVDAADVILVYEAPAGEGAREVRELADGFTPPDRHALRRTRVDRRRPRRADRRPAPATACVAER